LPWKIQIVQTSSGMKQTNEATPEQQRHIDAGYRILRKPNGDASFRVLLEEVLEDIIVGGYGCAEVVQTGDAAKPVDLYSVDGQTIRINHGWTIGDETPRYCQASGYAGLAYTGGQNIELHDDQILYFRLNPRTSTPFGYGYLETAFRVVNAFMGAFDYSERRASNATPREVLFLGEGVDVPTVRRWKQYWQQDIEGTGSVGIIGGGRMPQVLSLSGTGEDQLWIKWQEYLVRVVAMCFGLSPQKFAQEKDVNRSTAQVMSAEDWATVAPIANLFKDYITHKLFEGILGWHDIEFIWIVRDTDEKRQAEILDLRYNTDSITVDEIREIYGDPPLENGMGGWTKTPYEQLVSEATNEREPEFGGPPLWEEAQGDETHRREDDAPASSLADAVRRLATEENTLLQEASALLHGLTGDRAMKKVAT